MVLLDTNIIIDHLRQESKGDTALMKISLKIPKEKLSISVISVQELYEGKSTRSPAEEERLLSTITPLRILHYDYEIAQLAGELARDSKMPIDFTDAAIAATAVAHNARLATLNPKDFKDVPRLNLLPPVPDF
jgi:predicted nucleic acid-binding protein